MSDKLLELGIKTKLAIDNLGYKIVRSMKKENGDTNLISIIIVLGIVLALVVIFRGYIGKIIDKIKDSVDTFSNDSSFETTASSGNNQSLIGLLFFR
jgi:hypothetical protein